MTTMLIVAMGIGGLYLRRRRATGEGPAALSDDEQARLDEILGDKT